MLQVNVIRKDIDFKYALQLWFPIFGKCFNTVYTLLEMSEFNATKPTFNQVFTINHIQSNIHNQPCKYVST